jgi:hypothetical protein
MRGRRPIDALYVPDIRQMTTERAISSAKKSRFIYASERRFVAEMEAVDKGQSECPQITWQDDSTQMTQDNTQELWDFYQYGCPSLICPGLLKHSTDGHLHDYICSSPSCPIQIRSTPTVVSLTDLKQRIEAEVYSHARTGCSQLPVPTKASEGMVERVYVACRCGFWGVIL